MPDLTRRPDPHRADSWLVYYGDVHVGTISKRVGNPGAAEPPGNGCVGFIQAAIPANSAAAPPARSIRPAPRSRRPGASICQSDPRPTFRPGVISAIGLRKNIAALIAASRCRRIGGLVNCDRQRDSWMAPRINLVGQRFGYLTVTKQVEPQLYQWRKRRAPLRVPQYEVKCDCGTVKITKAKLLRNGSVKSCGCRRYPVRTCPAPGDRPDGSGS